MFKYEDTIDNFYNNFDMSKLKIIIELEDHIYGYKISKSEDVYPEYTTREFLTLDSYSRIDDLPIIKYNLRKIKIYKLLNEAIIG